MLSPPHPKAIKNRQTKRRIGLVDFVAMTTGNANDALAQGRRRRSILRCQRRQQPEVIAVRQSRAGVFVALS
jgi:hypothetical protein